MTHVRLIHWNAAVAKQKVSILESEGYEVDYAPSALQMLKELKSSRPVAVVIDLSRLPSQGRDLP